MCLASKHPYVHIEQSENKNIFKCVACIWYNNKPSVKPKTPAGTENEQSYRRDRVDKHVVDNIHKKAVSQYIQNSSLSNNISTDCNSSNTTHNNGNVPYIEEKIDAEPQLALPQLSVQSAFDIIMGSR